MLRRPAECLVPAAFWPRLYPWSLPVTRDEDFSLEYSSETPEGLRLLSRLPIKRRLFLRGGKVSSYVFQAIFRNPY